MIDKEPIMIGEEIAVELYRESSPASPELELAANFDPAVHVRWEFRPAVAEVDFHASLGELGEDGEVRSSSISARQRDALHRNGIKSLLDILRAGVTGLEAISGVGKAAASALIAWAEEHPTLEAAKAELANDPAEDLRGIEPEEDENEPEEDDNVAGNSEGSPAEESVE